MDTKEQLIQGLSDAGCTMEARKVDRMDFLIRNQEKQMK